MQVDQTSLSLSPGGGSRGGSRLFAPQFEHSAAANSDLLPRPHGGSAAPAVNSSKIMSQSTESSANSGHYWRFGEYLPILYCNCGLEMNLATCWEKDNPGRRYHRCSRFGKDDSCGFYQWFDVEMCDRSKSIIPGLLEKTNKLEADLNEKNRHVNVLNNEINVLSGKISEMTREIAYLSEKHSGVTLLEKEILDLKGKISELENGKNDFMQKILSKINMLSCFVLIFCIFIGYKMSYMSYNM